MSFDISILVADPTRLATLRAGVQLPGRVMPFTTEKIAAATDSIRANRPKIVAIEASFVQTPAGAAFVERIESVPGVGINLVARQDGKWVLTPRTPAIAPPAVAVVAAEPAVNTRRAPRFAVRDAIDAVIEGGRARVVDLSTHGAQLMSLPALRPNQKIKVGLPDDEDAVNVAAQVAWSSFEMTSDAQPIYRVGIEFSDAAQKVLDEYRQRHCKDQPIPVRAR